MHTNSDSQKCSATVVVANADEDNADRICEALSRHNVLTKRDNEMSVANANDVVVLITSAEHAMDALSTTTVGPTVLVLDGAAKTSLERATLTSLALGGADAVISLDDDNPSFDSTLATAVTTLSEGGTVMRPDVARDVVNHARGRAGTALSGEITLTRREVEILQCVGRGETVRKTAASLGISAKTVENLQSRLFRKLNVKDRSQAHTRATALGLLHEEKNSFE